MSSISNSQPPLKKQKIKTVDHSQETDSISTAQSSSYQRVSRIAAQIPKPFQGRLPQLTKSITKAEIANAVKENNIKLIKVAIQNPQTDLNYLFMAAIVVDRVEIVNLVLTKIEDIDAKILYDRNPLHLAVLHNREEIVVLLLENGADKEVGAGRGYTALHLAAEKGHKRIVELLIKDGADVDPVDWCSPLHLAATNGHKEVAKLLLEKGADPMQADGGNFTPMLYAATGGYKEIVELFIEQYNLLSWGYDVIDLFEVYDKQKEIVNLILRKCSDIGDGEGEHNGTLLHVAARLGVKEIVEILIELGADTEAVTETGKTPLHLAAENGHKDVVEYLLIENSQEKVDLDDLVDHPEIIKVLLGPLSNASYTQHEYRNLVEHAVEHCATEENFIKIANLLRDNGSLFNKSFINKLIHIAAENGKAEIYAYLQENTNNLLNVELILAPGRAPTVPKRDLCTLLAVSIVKKETVERLWKHFLKENTLQKELYFRDNTFSIPFLSAAKSESLSFLEKFYENEILSKGMTVDQLTCLGKPASCIALENKKFKAVEWLLARGADPTYLSKAAQEISDWKPAEIEQFNVSKKRAKETIAKEISRVFSYSFKPGNKQLFSNKYLPLNLLISEYLVGD